MYLCIIYIYMYEVFIQETRLSKLNEDNNKFLILKLLLSKMSFHKSIHSFAVWAFITLK